MVEVMLLAVCLAALLSAAAHWALYVVALRLLRLFRAGLRVDLGDAPEPKGELVTPAPDVALEETSPEVQEEAVLAALDVATQRVASEWAAELEEGEGLTEPVGLLAAVESKGPDFVCGGDKKRHNYRSSKVAGRCVNCGAPQPGIGQKAAVTTPEQAAAWRVDGAVPDVTLEAAPSAASRKAPAPITPADPAGAHISGPSTAKAAPSGATRSGRRGGLDAPLTIAGTEAEQATQGEAYWDEAAIAQGWCPRGHGPLRVERDEYGDQDTYCLTCGFRPTRQPAPDEVGPAPGKLRRREPSTNGMRI